MVGHDAPNFKHERDEYPFPINAEKFVETINILDDDFLHTEVSVAGLVHDLKLAVSLLEIALRYTPKHRTGDNR